MNANRLAVFWAACVLALHLPLRGDGIAVSHDGARWLKGAGGYGEAWGDSGVGLCVVQGEKVYIKYFSPHSEGRRLRYAFHGEERPRWRSIGPELADGVGDAPLNPVVLEISRIGTDRTVVVWKNGERAPIQGTAFTAPGEYDLSTDEETTWSLPPLKILPRQRLWDGFFARQDRQIPIMGPVSVPDTGDCGTLLSLALLSLVFFFRRKSP